MAKQKKFGLVFEKHEPEMTLLYDFPISRGCKVIRIVDDDKKLSEDILWEVKKVSRGTATCVHIVTKEEQHISVSDLISVAKNGEPIYKSLKSQSYGTPKTKVPFSLPHSIVIVRAYSTQALPKPKQHL